MEAFKGRRDLEDICEARRFESHSLRQIALKSIINFRFWRLNPRIDLPAAFARPDYTHAAAALFGTSGKDQEIIRL